MYIQSPCVNSCPRKMIDPPAINRMPSPSLWECFRTLASGGATVMKSCDAEDSQTGSCHFLKPLGTLVTFNSSCALSDVLSREVIIVRGGGSLIAASLTFSPFRPAALCKRVRHAAKV